MKQLSLFNESFFDKLQFMLNSLIDEYKLPTHSLHLFSNISPRGENQGQEISKSICIYEPEFPLVKEDVDNPGKNLVVMRIQEKSKIELSVRNIQFEAIPLPSSATVKMLKDSSFKHVLFKKEDPCIFSYIKENIIYCLKNYRSKERSFGCCSRFIQCSDEKRCVHENKLYSTACIYRHNLEAGKIFYGKNKNI